MILHFIPGPRQLIQAPKVAQHLGGARGDTSKGIVQKLEAVSSKKEIVWMTSFIAPKLRVLVLRVP